MWKGTPGFKQSGKVGGGLCADRNFAKFLVER